MQIFYCITPEQVVNYFEDYSWDKITTPINVPELHALLKESGYDAVKTEYIINGFTHGLSIGYEGPTDRKDLSDNLPLKGIGMKVDVWNKVMKEVQLSRYTGPYKYEEIKVDNFIQSPIGLVPKAGNQTRFIFHLSYEFKNGNGSLNYHTPHEKCTVKYRDLDYVIDLCLKLLKKHG